MVQTSTPNFCAKCHEIRPAVETWRTSTHASNDKGVVAECMDCHLPEPYKPVSFFFAKTTHGLKDVFAHLVQDRYDREKSREAVYSSFDNTACLTCHKNILYIPNKRGAMLAHKTVMFPRPGYEKKCTDCHQHLVHNESGRYRYERTEGNYRGLGL